MATARATFKSFIQAGFECSTHKRRDGYRLDLLKLTRNDDFAKLDYERVQALGMHTVRTAARWHLIESTPGEFNCDSLRKILTPAEETGTEILLDLLHFGWPDDLDILSETFPARFQRFAAAVTRFIRRENYKCCTCIAPINEISFVSWAGGEAACINPYQTTSSHQIKRALVRAAALASEVVLNELPEIRLISPEPVIHIVANPHIPGDDVEAEAYRLAQYQAWDMLSGRMCPELGGKPEYLDILGLNFYDRNEWVHNEKTFLRRSDPRFRPFRQILREVWERYRRPMFVAETGAEDDERGTWFNYICDEVASAMDSGVPVEGICIYPVLNHPGWVDDRHCYNGLFDYAGENGHREVYQPLADAIVSQTPRLLESQKKNHEKQQTRFTLPVSSSLGVRFSAPTTPNEPLCT